MQEQENNHFGGGWGGLDVSVDSDFTLIGIFDIVAVTVETSSTRWDVPQGPLRYPLAGWCWFLLSGFLGFWFLAWSFSSWQAAIKISRDWKQHINIHVCEYQTLDLLHESYKNKLCAVDESDSSFKTKIFFFFNLMLQHPLSRFFIYTQKPQL